jgi:hypothetical protein
LPRRVSPPPQMILFIGINVPPSEHSCVLLAPLISQPRRLLIGERLITVNQGGSGPIRSSPVAHLRGRVPPNRSNEGLVWNFLVCFVRIDVFNIVHPDCDRSRRELLVLGITRLLNCHRALENQPPMGASEPATPCGYFD